MRKVMTVLNVLVLLALIAVSVALYQETDRLSYNQELIVQDIYRFQSLWENQIKLNELTLKFMQNMETKYGPAAQRFHDDEMRLRAAEILMPDKTVVEIR